MYIHYYVCTFLHSVYCKHLLHPVISYGLLRDKIHYWLNHMQTAKLRIALYSYRQSALILQSFQFASYFALRYRSIKSGFIFLPFCVAICRRICNHLKFPLKMGRYNVNRNWFYVI